MAKSCVKPMTGEDAQKLKPGDQFRCIGDENWASTAEYMLDTIYTFQKYEGGMIHFKESATFDRPYHGVSFKPEWCSLDLNGAKRPLTPVEPLPEFPEGECPKCRKWQSHSVTCPEMGLV